MDTDRHVLIVDDEEKVVFFLRESFEELGHEFKVSTARSAEEALAKIDSQPYDLVISDLRMPGSDGLQLLETIKERNPATRFILMTAYGSDEVAARAQRLEAYDYITKPFRVTDLLTVARQALADRPESPASAPSLTGHQAEAIERALSNLRFEVGAQCAFLADRNGRIISEVGLTQGLEPGTFLPLVAKGVATTSGLAEYLKDEETFNLNFYEGKKYDIHSTTVDEDHFLTLVFDRTKQPSRIGMVWLYAKRTTEDLLRALNPTGEEKVATEPLEPIVFSESRSDAGADDLSQADRPDLASAAPDISKGEDRPEPRQEQEATFGIEEALRKGLIDEEFAQLLQGED